MLYKIITNKEAVFERLSPEKKLAPAILRKNITTYLLRRDLLPQQGLITEKELARGLHNLLLQKDIPEAAQLEAWLTQLVAYNDPADQAFAYHVHHLSTRINQQLKQSAPYLESLTQDLRTTLNSFSGNTTNKAIQKRHTKLLETIKLLEGATFREIRAGLLKLAVILPAYTYGTKKNITAYITLKNIFASIDPDLSQNMDRTIASYYKHSIKKATTLLHKLNLSTQALSNRKLHPLMNAYQKNITALSRELTSLPPIRKALLSFSEKSLVLLHAPETQYVLEDTEELSVLTKKLSELCAQIHESVGTNAQFETYMHITQKAIVPRNFDIVTLFSKVSRILKPGEHTFTIVQSSAPNTRELYIDNKKVSSVLLWLWGLTPRLQDTLGSLQLDLSPATYGSLHIEKLRLNKKTRRTFILWK